MTNQTNKGSKLEVRYPIAFIACGLLWSGAACAAPDGESITDIDRKIIVDCFLGRGTVRSTGGAIRVRPVPGHREQISKAACEARGGESILYDATDPKTAIQLWSGPAQAGDKEAQNRLGQIYELGIGREPDYKEAATWYRRAADAGNRAAALNLASLHDRGLGVPRDSAKAEQLYGAAVGTAPAANAAARDASRRKLEASQRQIDDLELAALNASGTSKAGTESEIERQRTALVDIVNWGDAVIEVGEVAGSRPLITLVDPNLVSTRGVDRVIVPSDIKTKDIVGRVRAKNGVSAVRVNGIVANTDRSGIFSARIPLQGTGTRVEIVAIDRKGVRETRTFVLQPAVAAGAASRAPSSAPKTKFGNYYALVIGNHHYGAKGRRERSGPPRADDWPDLPNAERDARAVTEILQKKYGFSRVQLMIDGTHDQVLNAINQYVIDLGPSDNLLIYYAGHGKIDLGKRGYWIPVDAEPQRNTRWIVNLQITDLLEKMQAKKVLVVSDSCYGGAMAAAENGAVSTIRTGLPDALRIDAAKPMVDARSRVMLSSGFLSPVAEGGGADHSLFARAFLDVLNANSGVLEGFQVFAALEARVLYAARNHVREQSPIYAAIAHAGHEGGDFFFVPAIAQR